MTENQRLKEIQKVLKFSSQEKFAQILGIKQGSLSDIYRSKDGIGVSSSIKRILEKEYSINIDWLETGEGEMLKSSDALLPNTNPYRMVPVFNLDAVGGSDNLNTDQSAYVSNYLPFMNAREQDISIPISGTSMYPTYSPGAYVHLREIERWREFLELGQVYVIELVDDRRLIKEIRCGEDHQHYLLHSHNPSFDDVSIPTDMIRRIWLVLAQYQKSTM